MQYIVNAPTVVGEIIDDEAVVLDLRSGRYFNTKGSGAEIWSGIEHGGTVEALAHRLAVRFEIELVEATEQVADFLRKLESYGLVRTTTAPSQALAVRPSNRLREPFEAPRLEIHSDLDDLLRLDPIHDVDQMGWPMAIRER